MSQNFELTFCQRRDLLKDLYPNSEQLSGCPAVHVVGLVSRYFIFGNYYVLSFYFLLLCTPILFEIVMYPNFIFDYYVPLVTLLRCFLVTLLPGFFVTLLLCYPVSLLLCYSVTLLLCYRVTLLPCYSVTLLPCYSVTVLLCYLVTLLPCYAVTVLLCYLVTRLHCYSVTL